MLYISRYIGYENFGVVDTDDGVEEEVAPECITECFLNLGLEIFGCDINDFPIHPYQPPKTKTQAQLKLELLSGIDTIVFRDVLANIRFERDEIKSHVVLRVSNFGTRIGDFLFRGNDVSGTPKITLVFDDKIAPVSEYALQPLICPEPVKGRDTLCVWFDFREVTNEVLINSLYSSLYTGFEHMRNFAPRELRAAVIDDAARKSRFMFDGR